MELYGGVEKRVKGVRGRPSDSPVLAECVRWGSAPSMRAVGESTRPPLEGKHLDSKRKLFHHWKGGGEEIVSGSCWQPSRHGLVGGKHL